MDLFIKNESRLLFEQICSFLIFYNIKILSKGGKMQFKDQIKAIIFDMDGTIIESEDIWNKAIRKVLSDNNVFLAGQDEELLFNKMIGRNLDICFKDLKDAFKIDKHFLELVEDCKRLSAMEFSKGVSFIKGFEPFHLKLQQNNIPSCIATNCDLETLEKINQSMNLSKFFGDKIFAAAHVSKPKPDPALFLHSAKQLNVLPEECIIFEDSLFGFQAAKAAGMKCIAIKNDKNIDLLHHADGVIEHYDFATEILNGIAKNLKSK